MAGGMTLTTVIAAAGLILALLSLWLRERDKKPTLVVTGSFAYVPGEEADNPTWYIFGVTNTGQMPLTLIYFFAKPRGGRILPFSAPLMKCDNELPFRLDRGDAVTCQVSRHILIEELKKLGYEKFAWLKVVAQDSRGKQYSKRVWIKFGKLGLYWKLFKS